MAAEMLPKYGPLEHFELYVLPFYAGGIFAKYELDNLKQHVQFFGPGNAIYCDGNESGEARVVICGSKDETLTYLHGYTHRGYIKRFGNDQFYSTDGGTVRYEDILAAHKKLAEALEYINKNIATIPMWRPKPPQPSGTLRGLGDVAL